MHICIFIYIFLEIIIRFHFTISKAKLRALNCYLSRGIHILVARSNSQQRMTMKLLMVGKHERNITEGQVLQPSKPAQRNFQGSGGAFEKRNRIPISAQKQAANRQQRQQQRVGSVYACVFFLYVGLYGGPCSCCFQLFYANILHASTVASRQRNRL